MSKTSLETGHAKNVARLGDLITYCNKYGKDYNPSQEFITVKGLSSLFELAKKTIADTHGADASYKAAIIARENSFKPLSSLSTRISNYLVSLGIGDHDYQNARAMVRKIQGISTNHKTVATTAENAETTVLKINTPDATNAEVINNTDATTHSTRQMSFDTRLENFNKLIILVSGFPDYNPNEEILKIASLKAMYDDLISKNAMAVDAFATLSNFRLQRNKLLYNNKTGLVDIANAVKAYVKAVFGAVSPEYKQVSGIKFNSYNY